MFFFQITPFSFVPAFAILFFKMSHPNAEFSLANHTPYAIADMLIITKFIKKKTQYQNIS